MRTLVLLAATSLICACSDDDKPKPDGSTRDATVADSGGKDAGPEADGPAADGEVSVDCSGKADGTGCGEEGMICLKSACVPSSCGDGFVDDKGGEDCEDGNDDPTDGCAACRYLCKENADCEDAETCNGTETCDTTAHKCAAGTFEADGTSCGADKVCYGGACSTVGCGNGVKDGSEECDDGNQVDGDGCDNTCTFSCKDDPDCDDGDACNGVETCAKDPDKQVCAAGSAPVCDDQKDCTTDSCDPISGCVNTPIDADGDKHSCDEDCDDNNAARYVGLPECADGIDNDCNDKIDDGTLSPGKCWEDKDGDGYASANAAMINNCACPAGYTNVDPTKSDGNDDCYDSTNAKAPLANPDQTDWFDYSYCVGKILIPGGNCMGTVSYDWNCDETTEKSLKYKAAATCSKTVQLGRTRCLGAGWVGTSVPECGVEAKYRNCTYDSKADQCFGSEVMQKQKCR